MVQVQEQSEAQSQSFCRKQPRQEHLEHFKKILQKTEASVEEKRVFSFVCLCLRTIMKAETTAEIPHLMSWSHVSEPHLLLLEILDATHECQIETDAKAVLEEEGGSAAVQLSFGDDGDAVAQQVGLVHVMSGQNHSPAWERVQPLMKCFLVTFYLNHWKISAHSGWTKKVITTFKCLQQIIDFTIASFTFVVAV